MTYSRDTFASRCPVTRREEITFLQKARAGTEVRKLEFTQEVLWLRMSEGRIVLRHRGVDLEVLQSTHDFYGFCSSFDCLGEATGHAEHYRARVKGDLEVVLEARLLERPALEMEQDNRGIWGMVQYRDISDDWMLPETKNLAGDGEDPWIVHRRLETEILKGWTALWTSARPDESQIEETRESWIADLPQEADDAE